MFSTIKALKTTIAISCYNLEFCIAQCLESVVAQDSADFEILVVDDHSTDKSVEIVREILNRHPEIPSRHIINEKNLGLCMVRNIAIEEARGEYLLFVDGDDTLEPYALSLLRQVMVMCGTDVVCGSFRKVDRNGNTILEKRYPASTCIGDYAIAKYIETQLTNRWGLFPVTAWNKLYNLDFLRRNHIRCNDSHKFYEDYYFSFQIVLLARNVAYISQITYNYVQSSISLCNQRQSVEHTENIYAALESVFRAFADFKSMRQGKEIPRGIMYLLNMICLTEGLLYRFLHSELSKREKKEFLGWLKNKYRENGIERNDVVGIYNKMSYLILTSPFPYSLFMFYFKNLKTIVKAVNLLTY